MRTKLSDRSKEFWAVVVIAAMGISFITGAVLFATFDQGGFIWNVNTGTYGASVQGHYVDVAMGSSATSFSVWAGDGGEGYTPPTSSTPPTTPPGGTTTATSTNNWQASINFGTIIIYPPNGNGGQFGTGTWGAPGYSGTRFTISPVVPIDKSGNPTADGNPVVANSYTDTTTNPNKVWKQYYFKYEAMIATNAVDGNDLPVEVMMYAGCNLQNGWTNSSYENKFGGAQIVAVDTGTTTADDMKYLTGTHMPGSSDVAPVVTPYQTAGSLGGILTVGSASIGNTWYIMPVGGHLTPAKGYTYFGISPTGISFHIQVYIKYTVHFSVLCSEPPVVNSADMIKPTLDNYADKHGEAGTFLLDFLAAYMWLILIIIGVIVFGIVFIIFVIPTMIYRKRSRTT